MFVHRVEPDEKIQTALTSNIATFLIDLMLGKDKLRELGVVPYAEAV